MMTKADKNHAPVIIVSGTAHCGKTSLLAAVLPQLVRQGWNIAGILAEGHWRDNRRSGFTLIDLSNGRRTPLAKSVVDGGPHAFPYIFNPQGLIAGRQALTLTDCFAADLVVIDEIGSLEVNGGGWAGCLPALLRPSGPPLLWVVQSRWLELVCAKWEIAPEAIIDAADPAATGRLCGLLEAVLERNDNRSTCLDPTVT